MRAYRPTACTAQPDLHVPPVYQPKVPHTLAFSAYLHLSNVAAAYSSKEQALRGLAELLTQLSFLNPSTRHPSPRNVSPKRHITSSKPVRHDFICDFHPQH